MNINIKLSTYLSSYGPTDLELFKQSCFLKIGRYTNINVFFFCNVYLYMSDLPWLDYS
jgi:hypothetical protein